MFAAGVAAHLPAVVNVDVNVTRIFHARLYNRVGHALDQILADIAGELVPRIPSHGRGQRQIRRRRSFLLRNQTGDEKQHAYEEDRQDISHFHAHVLPEVPADWY